MQQSEEVEDAGRSVASEQAESEALSRRLPVMTWVMIFACVALTLATWYGGRLKGTPLKPLATLARQNPYDIWDGEYAWLFLSIFIHGNIVHLVFNMMWMLHLGSLLERTLHPVVWILFFLGAAFVGSTAELAVSDQTGIGASGVVYAMFGLVWSGRWYHAPYKQYATPSNMRLMLGWALLWVVIPWIAALLRWTGQFTGLADQLDGIHMANATHFAGFALGLATGWLFLAHRRKALATVMLTGLYLTAVLALTWMPWSHKWTSWKGMHELSKREYIQAMGWFARTIQLGGDPVWAWEAIALAERERGNFGAAQEAHQRAIASLSAPEHRSPREGLSRWIPGL